MKAIDAIRQMSGRYSVIRTDPLNKHEAVEDTCDADRVGFFKSFESRRNVCHITLPFSFNCYDARDRASIDSDGVVRILVITPNGNVWLDTFTPADHPTPS